jgi:hypothetical protein
MQRCVKISKQSVKNFRIFKTLTNEHLHFYLYRLMQYLDKESSKRLRIVSQWQIFGPVC